MLSNSIFRFSRNEFFEFMKSNVQIFSTNGSMEAIIPRKYTTNHYLLNQQDDVDVLTKNLSSPIYDLIDRGGKRWRPALCFLIAYILKKDPRQMDEIAAAIEFIHNGSLIVDDIEDSSEVRRGKPCVHLIHGVDTAINAGNFMYFVPIDYLLQSTKYDDKQKLLMAQTCARLMTRLHLGQGWDIGWHKQTTYFPTIEQYLRMAENKTGILAEMAVQLSYLAVEQIYPGKSIGQFVSRMGIGFQIQDVIVNLSQDILNLVGSDKFKNSKGALGEDIHEGKFTLIIIHSLLQNRNQRLLDILSMKTFDQGLINEAIEIVIKTGSIEFAQQYAKQLIDTAWEQVSEDLSVDSREYLKYFAEYLTQRDH